MGKKKLLSFSPQVKDPLNGGINILTNQNHMWIRLIQASTTNPKSIQYISNNPSYLKCEVIWEVYFMNYSENNIYSWGHLSLPCVLSHMTDIIFHILRIITLLYHMYIEHEIYHMAYKKLQNRLNEYQFIEWNIGKWDGFITLCENIKNKGYWLYLKL